MTDVKDRKEYRINLVFTEGEWRKSEFEWSVDESPIGFGYDPYKVTAQSSEYRMRFPGTVKFQIEEKTITAYDQGYEAGLKAGREESVTGAWSKGYEEEN